MKCAKLNIKLIYWLLFSISVGLGLYYLLMLGWYNIPSLDDYRFVEKGERLGIFAAVANVYRSFAGRYIWYFFTYLECLTFGRATNLLLMTVKNLIFCYCCTWIFVHFLCKFQSWWKEILITIFLANMGIVLQQASNTFYWLCTSTYVNAAFMLLPLLVALFADEMNKILRWIIVIIISFLLGGGAENFTPLILFGLGCSFVYKFITNGGWNYVKSRNGLLLLCSICILFANFMVVFCAPGNMVRISKVNGAMTYRNHFELLPFLIADARIVAYLLGKVVFFIPCYILITFVFSALSSCMAPNSVLTNYSWKQFLFCVMAYCVFVIIEQTLCLYGTGGAVYDRACVFIYLGAVVLFALLGIVIGNTIKEKMIVKIAGCLALLCFSSLWGILIYKTHPVAKEYHDYVHSIQTTIDLEVQKGRTEVLTVKNYEKPYVPTMHSAIYNLISKIRGSEILYFNSFFPYNPYIITNDPSCWENIVIKRYHGAQFDIVAQDYNGPYNR